MAVFKIKEKKKSPKNAKKITGIVLLAVCTIFLFCLVTNLVPFMHGFLLGCFGIAGYPLFSVLFLVALAFINNKRYTYPKRFTVFLILSIFFLLCIIQTAIIGNKFVGEDVLSYGQHLGLSYLKKYTAGGIVIGLFTSSMVYLVGYVWTYVFFSGLFVVSLALLVDILRFMIKSKRAEKPIKLSLKDKYKEKPKEEIKIEEPVKTEKIKPSIGMVRRSPETYERKIEAPKEEEKPQSILTPIEDDFQKFYYSHNRIQPQENKDEIEKNIAQLKEESISPEQTVHNETFSFERERRVRGSLPDINPEEVVSEVDDIIKEVVRESGIEPENNQNQEAQPRSDRSFDRSERGFDRSERALDRGERSFDRSERSFERSERGFDRSERRFVNIENDESEDLKQEVVKPYNYSRPPIDLITTKSSDMSEFDEGVAEKTVILENTLEQFGVAAKVQDVVIGPAVTRYELEMPSGVTVKKILNLSSDIALTLEANGGDVRIEAPVPGRNVVGIEVPNDKVAMVSLKDIISSQEFKNAKSPLTYAVGKDITGNIIVGDLASTPHLLIAGTTGSGKSVMLNGIILSLIYKSSPDEVRLLLVDPKQVEFKVYEGIPHLLTPRILTDVTKASNALSWAVDEMERRFKLIGDAGLRDIGEYNKTEAVLSGKKKKMPYIVLIIDEFSDFMMTSKKEVEDKIVRLGQKARAAGIHMILATQRPTIESVTGAIKANFPSRIAFKVAGRVNSDVILGTTGAEKLLGRGDMLYAPIESSANPKRVQGSFVSTQEVLNIVNYVTLNNEQEYDPAIQDAINNVKKNDSTSEERAMDPLLPEALKICIESNQASCSMIQRKLSLGFSRAGRILDQMTDFGYISAPDGAKPRKVYITLEEYYKIFGEQGV